MPRASRPASRRRGNGTCGLALCATLFLFLSGCLGTEPSPSTSVHVDTLPGGAVRVVNPGDGLWAAHGAWRLTPDLVLGTVAGPEPSIFGRIVGLQANADGRIYVLDAQTNELRIFASGGALLRTVGGSGKGPGEYTAALGLLRLPPDSLIVVDEEGARYSILDADGDFVRSVARPLRFTSAMFKGWHHDGRIYEPITASKEDQRRPVLLAVAIRGPQTGSMDAPVDTIDLPEPDGPLYGDEWVMRRGSQAVGFWQIPFSPVESWTMDDRGTVWSGHGSVYRVLRTSLDGDTLLETEVLDAPRAPVTPAEIDERISEVTLKRWRSLGGTIDRSRIPALKPFFDALYVDPDGYLWVSVPGRREEVRFDVFENGGRYFGRLSLHGFERPLYGGALPVVRDDRLYLVGRDTLDVQQVRVFRIQR